MSDHCIFLFFCPIQGWKEVGYSEQCAEAAFIGKTTAGWADVDLGVSVFPIGADGCRLM